MLIAKIGQAFRRAFSPPEDRDLARPQRARKTPYAQRDLHVGGVRLRYIDVEPRERAEGTIVLLPGHTSRIEEYDELVPTLARRHRVLVLDFPGSGYSEKPNRSYTLELYERTLLGFLDLLGVERAHLAGGSLGGNLVMRLGHRHPDRFPRLLAWAPAGAWDPNPRLARAGRILGGWLLFWPMVWAQSRYWYEPSWTGRRAALEDTFTYYREVLGPGFVRMYWGIGIDQVGRSLFGSAPETSQPTLLVWGDRDHGMNLGEGVARLHKLLPRAELHVIEGARHSLASEVPERLAQLIDDFLRRNEDEKSASPSEASVMTQSGG